MNNHLFYDEASASDIGTMHAARCHLNARNVPKKAMQDVDATYEFLQQYIKALVITMWKEIKPTTEYTESVNGMDCILDKMVDTFIIPGIEIEETTDDIFTCPTCQKKYKTITG